LDSKDKIRAKLDMLQNLRDMQITRNLIKETVEDEDLVISNYKKLNCKISPLDKLGK
jgi:hypothetical protein